LQSDRLFSGVERNGGVAIVNLGAVIGDLLKDRVAFDDVQSESIGSRKNTQNDIVCLNDGLQRPNFVVGRANEMAGLGCEFT
jgi:hypothetical protein